MSQLSLPPVNPYQPSAPAPAMPAVDTQSAELRFKLKKFRDQIHALGAFWIIIGVLSAGLGIFLLTTLEGARVESAPIVGGVMLVAATVWIGFGVATCLKQIWAVYVGLVLSYLSVLGNLINWNLCGLILMVLAILQAHRVIGWANELKRLGVPLDAKP